MIKNMLFPYDKEEYLNRFVSAAVYTGQRISPVGKLSFKRIA